jgi:hypothetical protein
MKRSPLSRHTPLRRRARLRPVSPKRRRENWRDRGTLDVFALTFNTCWRCGGCDAPWRGLEIHHLAGRRHPHRNHRANLGRFCADCHLLITDAKVGMIEVLALKRQHDPEGFDLKLVLEIKGWGPNAILESELDAWRPTSNS